MSVGLSVSKTRDTLLGCWLVRRTEWDTQDRVVVASGVLNRVNYPLTPTDAVLEIGCWF